MTDGKVVALNGGELRTVVVALTRMALLSDSSSDRQAALDLLTQIDPKAAEAVA